MFAGSVLHWLHVVRAKVNGILAQPGVDLVAERHIAARL
jgi:hypothetical protein